MPVGSLYRRSPDIDDTLAGLDRLRERAPLVHCLTNSIAAQFMANAVLAVGASPAMIADEAEVAEFAEFVDATVIDLASLRRDRVDVMWRAAEVAGRRGAPWLLDPAAIGRLALRTGLALDLLTLRPSVVKANASEILVLAGGSSTGRGADSTVDSTEAIGAAREVAGRIGGAVVVTGVVDYVVDEQETIAVRGGHPVMARVTGTGCALGAVIGAFLGAGITPTVAAAAAATVYATAGERAARRSAGPGSFPPAFLDELHAFGTEPR